MSERESSFLFCEKWTTAALLRSASARPGLGPADHGPVSMTMFTDLDVLTTSVAAAGHA